jgi:MFS transporter, Spinster family, sphingosine-1-phosphate transporter
MAGAAVVIAVPFLMSAILDPERVSSFAMLFVAMVLLASVLGPCNTVTANVVPPNQRAAGFALGIFLMHLFGDISSPILIGVLSELLAIPRIVKSPIGGLLGAIGATPIGGTNLTAGMLAVIPVMLLGGFLLFRGSRHLIQDEERARKLSGGDTTVGARMH